MELVCGFVAIEWIGRSHDHPLHSLGATWPWPFRWAIYYALMLMIYVYAGATQQFIYFEF